MTIAVIGRGLIGSAAARHLAEGGAEVVLIGPPEPEDKATHGGVFGSHYDEGRITRGLDPDPFWSRVSLASIARYRELEARSGIAFFDEVGTLMAGAASAELVAQVEAVAERNGIAAERLDADALRARFPMFAFPDDAAGHFEARGAGHVSPRRLVAAQTRLAEAAGARLVPLEATGLRETSAGVEIATAEGPVRADRALLATGGFAGTLLPGALDLKVCARTVCFAEIDDEEAARLAGQPTLIWHNPIGDNPYLLPPIRYPDGAVRLKIGGDPKDIVLPDAEATKAWFRSGGSAEVAAHLEGLMRARIPGLRATDVTRAACVTTYTPRNRPVIARLTDRLACAVAGNGKGAKCSDELGRIGAEAVLGRCDPALAA